MGRGKLPMELIANERARNSTFKKRKNGLKKKLSEFTTLCDVDACMILYGPYSDGRKMDLDIWPSDIGTVNQIIGKYKSKSAEEKAKRNLDLSDFFEKRKNKITEDIAKVRRANNKAKYPGLDDRILSANMEELTMMLVSIDQKIKTAQTMKDLMKDNNQLAMISFGQMMQPSPQSLYQRDMQFEGNNHLQDTKPFYQNYMFDQDFMTRSMSDMNNQTAMNDAYCFGPSSSNDVRYMTPMKSSYCYDSSSSSAALIENGMYNNCYYTGSSSSNEGLVMKGLSSSSAGLIENGMYNNCYYAAPHYSPPITQQTVHQQLVQYPLFSSNLPQMIMPSAPYQMNDHPQINESFYADDQFQNKRSRYL